jgi:hypothetical protein
VTRKLRQLTCNYQIQHPLTRRVDQGSQQTKRSVVDAHPSQSLYRCLKCCLIDALDLCRLSAWSLGAFWNGTIHIESLT